MAVCLTYLAYRTKHVFSSPDATLLILATLAIEIAIAGKRKIGEISSTMTRLTIPSSTLTHPAIDFWSCAKCKRGSTSSINRQR